MREIKGVIKILDLARRVWRVCVCVCDLRVYNLCCSATDRSTQTVDIHYHNKTTHKIRTKWDYYFRNCGASSATKVIKRSSVHVLCALIGTRRRQQRNHIIARIIADRPTRQADTIAINRKSNDDGDNDDGDDDDVDDMHINKTEKENKSVCTVNIDFLLMGLAA